MRRLLRSLRLRFRRALVAFRRPPARRHGFPHYLEDDGDEPPPDASPLRRGCRVVRIVQARWRAGPDRRG